MDKGKVIPFKKPADPFTKDAKERWSRIPEWAQKKILESVFCTGCIKSTTIVLESAKMQREDLILSGTCKVCGHKVRRLVEPEN